MPRKAIVDKQTGLIINVIEADDSFKVVLPDDVEMIDAPYRAGYEIGNVVDLSQPELIAVDIQTEDKVPIEIPKNVLNPHSPPNVVSKIPPNVVDNLPPNVKLVRSCKVVTDYQKMTSTNDETERQRVINEWNQKIQLALNKFNEVASRFKVPEPIDTDQTINDMK